MSESKEVLSTSASAESGRESDGYFELVPLECNFPKEEEDVLRYWEEHKCFETSLQQSKGRIEYTFYDGPPFATGRCTCFAMVCSAIKPEEVALTCTQSD